MKQYIAFLFVLTFSYTAYSQNSLLEGDKCFDTGDYNCAEIKYKESYKLANETDKQIVEIKIQRAKWCADNLKIADEAYASLNYSKAKENYQFILDSNPRDNYAKSQIDKCNSKINESTIPTLTLSKTELSFNSSGGSEKITIYTNSNSYEIQLLPAWCTVQKYDRYFEVICNSNYNNTARTDYFNVKAGNKTVRINIAQQGTIQAKENSLNLSKTELSFKSSGGSEKITISTNSNSYNIGMLPTWCTVRKYDSYFEVICNANYKSTFRTDYFNVKAGNKTLSVNIFQQGSDQGTNNAKAEAKKQPISYKTDPFVSSKSSGGVKKLNSFSSLGFQSGEIAQYGLLYESGGKRTIGFHISARTSLTPENDILYGTGLANKTEADLGPNLRITNRIYLNLGIGYGYYDKVLQNDYAGTLMLEKTGYILATSGLMIRISRVININGGVSFMDIDNEFYKPEITFGVSFNLKNKYSY